MSVVQYDDVPDVAIRWMVRHGVTSNTQHACLANVNTHWRTIVLQELARLVGTTNTNTTTTTNNNINNTPTTQIMTTTPVIDEDTTHCHPPPPPPPLQSSLTTTSTINIDNNDNQYHRPLLLLASMLQQLQYTEEPLSVVSSSSSSSLLLLQPQDVSHNNHHHQHHQHNHHQHNHNTKEQTFCVAWFHPSGIQELPVSLGPTTEQDDDPMKHNNINNNNTNNNNTNTTTNNNNNTTHIPTVLSEPFAPGGEETYDISDDEDHGQDDRIRPSHSYHHRPPPTTSHATHSQSPHSSHCRRHKDTSNPLATNNININNNINKRVVVCAKEWTGYQSPWQVLQPFGYTFSFVRQALALCQYELRPPQSCDTSPSNPPRLRHSSSLQHDSATFAVRGATVARPDSYCLCLDDDYDTRLMEAQQVLAKATQQQQQQQQHSNDPTSTSSEWIDIRLQELQQSIARRNQRKRELQMDVLPRVLAAKPDNSIGRRQASLQFLNATGSHAVCMTTPYFECGPLTEPLTILCVGIATEDGCFLSGLFHRFELGHMYPDTATAEATELSSVCIATESWQQNEQDEKDDTTRGRAKFGSTDNHPNGLPFKISFDDSSYDISDEEDGGPEEGCRCVFRHVAEKLEFANQEADVEHDHDVKLTADRIFRGRMGPGTWHCYVAVVDGANSQIRIDGMPEPGSFHGTDQSKTHNAMLEGLTIGSDHCFGMSLCCGFGSGGEGEGAIAEVAVFRGRLDEADIELLERQLMERHGIPSLASGQQEQVWRDYEMTRQSQALFLQTPQIADPTASTSDEQRVDRGVPLRYLSRHRSVAWKQWNAVTGDEMQLAKIGAGPPDDESSDW